MVWAGWKDDQRNELNPPDAVLTAHRRYQLDSDTGAQFVDDYYLCNGHSEVGSNDVFQAFRGRSRRQDEPFEMTQKALIEALDAPVYNRKRTNSGPCDTGSCRAEGDEPSWGRELSPRKGW